MTLGKWKKCKIGWKRSFRVSPKRAQAMRKAWKDWVSRKDDGCTFDDFFKFGWIGDTLDFKVRRYPHGMIATVYVTTP